MEILLIIIVLVLFFYYKKKKKKKKYNRSTVTFETTFSKSTTKLDKDSFEGWFYDEVKDYISINKYYKIKYKDANNNLTNRKIYIKKYGNSSFGGFILAHCELRNENRTFRIDRILECIDDETGEFIENISLYFQNIYLNSEEYKNKIENEKYKQEKEISQKYHDEFLAKYNTLLKIIIYLVRCDGSFNAKEKAIIKELFENLEEDNKLLTDKFLNKVLSNISLPTERIFKISVNKFIKENLYPNIDLVELSNNIIATQKTIHPSEEEALKFIIEKYKK